MGVSNLHAKYLEQPSNHCLLLVIMPSQGGELFLHFAPQEHIRISQAIQLVGIGFRADFFRLNLGLQDIGLEVLIF